VKLTVKGSAAVDPESELEDSHHVLEEGGVVWNAVLGMVDVVRGLADAELLPFSWYTFLGVVCLSLFTATLCPPIPSVPETELSTLAC